MIKSIQRRQIAPNIRHIRSLPRHIEIVLAIADEQGKRDLTEELVVQRVVSQLGEPLERRRRVEGPETLVGDSADARGSCRVESDLVHFNVKGFCVAGFEERYY